MALILKDRVKETTTTTGTGTLTLAGAVAGFQSFSVIGNGNTTYYTITDGTNWEVGIGTYTSSGTTLSRDTILESSNAGSAVNFGAGTKEVFVTYPAERSMYVEGSSIVPATSATLPVASGGTGQTTAQAAINTLAGATTSGQYLRGNGTNVVMSAIQAGDVPTLNQNTTGTAANVTGTVAIANGGTGQTTANAALNALLPSQGSNSGKYLTTDGSNTSWGTVSSSTTLTISNQTGAYTVVAGDLGKIINCSGTFTVSLTAAATLGSGFYVWVWNTGTDVITIDPNGSETIEGQSTWILRRLEGIQVISNGTNWNLGDKRVMQGYAENYPSAQVLPVASGLRGLALGISSNATGARSISIGNGEVTTTASGSSSVAILGTASSTNSFAAGLNSASGGSQAVTGAGAMALGGSYASGTDSFAAAITNNTSTYGATAANAVAIGFQATASASKSTAIGGERPTASASNAVAIGGEFPTASAVFAVALGGSVNTASGEASYAYGSRAQAIQVQKYAYGHQLGVSEACQGGYIVLAAGTTNATATVLRSNTNAATTANQLILPNNSAYSFTGIVVARRQASGGTESAAWKVEGLIRREGAANTTTLVASTVTAISNVPAWTLALSADTTNGGLKVEATGAASTNIRWVATIQTSEVTYA